MEEIIIVNNLELIQKKRDKKLLESINKQLLKEQDGGLRIFYSARSQDAVFKMLLKNYDHLL